MARRSRTRNAAEALPVWYEKGLRFECQPDCGACCTNHGDYGYVYVTDADVDALAALLRLERETFLERYTEIDDGWVVLKMDGKDCMFLDEKRCGVYGARPVQCRTFPFWSENLNRPQSWEQLCEFCPGIGKGAVHDVETIVNRLESRKMDV